MTDDARQTVEALDPGLKPFLKPRSSPSFRQKQDSETKLAENDRIEVRYRLTQIHVNCRKR